MTTPLSGVAFTAVLLLADFGSAGYRRPAPLTPPPVETTIQMINQDRGTPTVIPGNGRTRASSRSAVGSATLRPASIEPPRPPFLRRPIFFSANSQELSISGRKLLKATVNWLELHPDARVLIVGSCDESGSETCTRPLAESRALAIEKVLTDSGIDLRQISGVKAWDSIDHRCGPADSGCQQLDRSARIFVASSVAR